jgi:hypothetical protein
MWHWKRVGCGYGCLHGRCPARKEARLKPAAIEAHVDEARVGIRVECKRDDLVEFMRQPLIDLARSQSVEVVEVDADGRLRAERCRAAG